MFFDPMYFIFMLPAVLLAAWAQSKVTGAYKKYSIVGNTRGITGYQAARYMLDQNGLNYVQIQPISGELTDHFDPRSNVISLSQDIYGGSSLAAVGVACHECGHAIQHAVNYKPLVWRNAIIPITNIGSKLALPLIIAGLILSIAQLAYLGIICFSLSALFQLLTLPTEFDASKRALANIREHNMLSEGAEYEGAKAVLDAAALTYVAALATSLLQLLYFISLVNRGSRR